MRKLLSLLPLLAALLVLASPGVRAAELVMFDDPACVWCRKWLKEVGPGYPLSEEGRIAPLRRVDIKAQASAGLALKTPVTATPTFVVADDEGREVGRITGYAGADFFYPSLGAILGRLPQTPRRPLLRETRAN
ncbi:MAG: thioredoxin fold domain-containing protein [Hyphomicrobiaceae bacterium]|nr:thioredoxin fold domain-containing protein [Hyphomicrobiaceae bacterium]